MSLSRFLSFTSLTVVGAAAGCSDPPTCGPGTAPDSDVIASATGAMLSFGHATASRNNDCPAGDAPAGVVSLTIDATQVDDVPASDRGRITLCIGRPDLLGSQALALGTDVHVVDFLGGANGCSLVIDRAQATGTVRGSGVCGNGNDPAGFALAIDGAAMFLRTCGAATDSVAMTLRGQVAVSAAQ